MITWLASYPKSGNTWVRAFISGYLAGQVDLNHLRGTVPEQDPYFLQVVAPKPRDQLTQYEMVMLRPVALMHVAYHKRGGNVIVKTHNAVVVYGDIPMIPQMLTKAVIHVVRDPRDMAVSQAHHFGLTYDEAIERITSENNSVQDRKQPYKFSFLCSWEAHTQSWLNAPCKDRVTVRYEDMLENPRAEFDKIAKVLGFRNEERVADAVEMCSFGALQEQESERDFVERSPQAERFFRAGRVGEWREALTAEQVRAIEECNGKMMKKMGYPLSEASK